MPSVRERFVTYHSFAKSTLEEIYGERIGGAKEFEATTLASAVFINDGNPTEPRFQLKPMPELAQLSPVFGMSVSDADGDDNLDLILVQNFHNPQRETGQMNGGLGMLLTGKGNGEFETAWPSQSGIAIPEDAKSLVLCDSNRDQRPDFFVGINDGALQLWENQNKTTEFLSIRLIGKKGNLSAAGATVTILKHNGREQRYEIQSGSGYLSQRAPQLFVCRKGISSILIVWPDGSRREVSEISDSKLVVKQ